MSAGNRDVAMQLSVTTVGTESVKQLQSEVQALAKQGGAAAPEFQKLAAEIGKSGEQAKLVETTRALSSEIERLGLIQSQASDRTTNLRTELAALGVTTANTTSNEIEARNALQASQAAIFEKRQPLATLKNETSAANRENVEYTDQVRQLNREIIGGKTEIRALAGAYREAKTQTRDAATAEANLAKAVGITARESVAARAALDSRKAALIENQQALQASGIAARDVAGAEVALMRAYLATVGAVDAVTAAQKKAATSATATGEAINSALGTVGVRSVAAIQGEITKVRSAFDLLRNSGTLTGSALDGAFTKANSQVRALEREVRAVNGQLTLSDKAANLFSSSMGQFAAGNLVASGVAFLANKVLELGQAFIAAIIQGDQLKRGLNAIFNDARKTAEQIDFLRKTASESGVAVGALSADFVKFSASMKFANIPLEQSNQLFKAVVSASAAMGLGADATAGALNALGQMAAKGVVSMEELRQQLGDRLPGALSLAAKGMGITEAQLIKLVESGSLATRDFIVPLTNGLREIKGETDGLMPTWERFKGLLTATSQGAGDAGWAVLLGGALKALAAILGGAMVALAYFSEKIFLAGAAALAFGKSLTGNGDALGFFVEQVGASNKRIDAMTGALGQVLSPSTSAADATKNLGAAVAATAGEIRTAEVAVKQLATAHTLSGAARPTGHDGQHVCKLSTYG